MIGATRNKQCLLTTQCGRITAHETFYLSPYSRKRITGIDAEIRNLKTRMPVKTMLSFSFEILKIVACFLSGL